MNALSPLPANDDGAIVVSEPVIAPTSIMSKIIELASTPGLNPEMVDRLIAWHEREQARQSLAAFNTAKNAVESELKAVVRNAVNKETRSTYATLDAVYDAIHPIYTKHGFAISFTETPSDEPELKIACILALGDYEKTYYLSAMSDTVGPQGKPNKTNVQGVGSTSTYLRRYLICLIFNVALRDDNDGNRQKPTNDTGEVIGRAAIDLLTELIAETNTDERKLLAHMGFPDLTTIKDVPAREFAKFKNALLSKKDTLAQRAARLAFERDSARLDAARAADVR